MTRSLRTRLVRGLLAVLLPVWVAMASWTYWSVVEEVDEIYDQQLMELALPLLPQSVDGLKAALNDIPIDDPDGDGVELAVLAWSAQGAALYRSPMAPAVSFGERPRSTAALRVAHTLRFGERSWRGWWFEQPGSQRWLLVLKPMTERNELARALAIGLGLPTLLTVLVLTPVVSWVVRLGLRPLNELGQQIARRRGSDLSPVGSTALPSEAAPLVSEINALMTRLQRTLEAERRFTADASHELRTPLAACRAQLQVAQRATSADERERALARGLEALDRSTRLTEGLLTLARLDHHINVQPGDGWLRDVDLVALVRARVAESAMGALHKGVSVALHAAEPVMLPQAQPDWLGMAIDNLLSNAIKHTPAGGSVDVVVEMGQEGPEVRVEDSGPGVPAAALGRLGARFERAGSQSEGVGLGLSIAMRVATLHGATLTFSNRVGAGLTARLVWRAPLRLESDLAQRP